MWGPVEPQGRKKERGKRDEGQEREEALRFAEEILRSDQKDLRSVLYRDILLNALKAKRDELDILDLKVINRAMAEFRYAARVFKPYRGVRKVSIFGSAREKKGHPYYELAVRLGRLLVGKGFMVITGAAEGIMRAGIEGPGQGDPGRSEGDQLPLLLHPQGLLRHGGRCGRPLPRRIRDSRRGLRGPHPPADREGTADAGRAHGAP